MSSSADGDSSGRQIRQRFSRWLNNALSKRNKSPPPPEPLTVPRPRPITPPDSAACHAQGQSPLFTSLPPEIRRDILLIAFGNSHMHMDLTLDHPMLGQGTRNIGGSTAHCGYTGRRDVSAPKQWAWRSCVCHRNLPWPLPPHSWWRLHWYRPDQDQCVNGNGLLCGPQLWLGEWPFKCRVGAMGWLLSCRKAYIEGIDLLYETNQFHISGEHLLSRLPDYILPPRLAQMRSFELVLSLDGFNKNDSLFQPACANYSALLSMLRQHTGVRRLHLVLLFPRVPTHLVNMDVQPILDAMDGFVRAIEPECVILQMENDALRGLQVSDCDLDTEAKEAWQGKYAMQPWRCLDGDATQARTDRRMCLYPHVLAPLQNPALPELGRSRGYWIIDYYPDRYCLM